MPRAWSTWYPDILPHVPGCPGRLAVHELRRASQDFFKTSRAWKVVPAVFPVAANQTTVTVLPDDSGMEMVRVEMAWYDGKPMGTVTPETLDATYSDDWSTHTGTPEKILQLTPGIVQLYPLPTVAATTGLKVRMSVRPSDTSTGLPDDIAVKFREDIFIGARAKLLAYLNAPWSKPDVAMVLSMEASMGASKANFQASKSYGGGRIASRPKWV
jgi:hypothetical protein